MERELTVMSRKWCHLCHDLEDRLRPLAAELGWTVRVLDVDADPELEARWDELVPAVVAGDTELCHYYLDEAAVRTWCGRFPLESAA